MKSNLIQNQNAVLTTDTGEIVAVIGCKPGKQDLTAQITQAIKDHESAELVQIDHTEGNFELLETVEIFVTLLDENEDEDERSYYIELTSTY